MGLIRDGVFVPVAQPHPVVVEVMGRSDLDAAGTERRVHMLVGDDGNTPAGEGQFHQFPQQVLIALVAGMHRHRAVAQQGFRAGGGHHQMAGAVGQGIAHVPEAAGFFLADDLQIRHRRMQLGVPIHQALAPVDEPFLVQPHEHFLDRVRQAGVHGEAFRGPVQGRTQAPQLAGDVAAGFPLPGPHSLDESVPAKVVAGQAGGFQLAFHHHLGGDAGMVGARLPKGGPAPHPLIADQAVHDGVVEPMPHVQAAGDIGRRNHDAVGGIFAGAGREPALVLPGLIPALFQGLGVVIFVHRGCVAGLRKRARL